MDEGDLGASSIARSSAVVGDDVGLLSGRKTPVPPIPSPLDAHSKLRGRHSREPSNVEETELFGNDNSLQERSYNSAMEREGAPKSRKPFPGPSSASSLLRRLTTLRSPISSSKRWASKRSRGQQYENLADNEV